MTPTTAASIGPIPQRTPARGARFAFGAMLLRDLHVLRKNLKEFLPRTLLQPVLLVFVFTYVLPKIGLGVGGGGAAAAGFTTVLLAGVIGLTTLMQGLQSVAIPMVQEFGYTREIEDRIQAPLPVGLVAVEKIAAGALNGLIAVALVFPIAAIVPATPVNLTIDWPVLVTLLPIACITTAALGLSFGTVFEPRTVPLLFGIIVLPLTFLGATYYSWAALTPIKWLKILVLFNPLVYINEGFRAAVTPAAHMSLWVVYPGLIGFALLFTWNGIRCFKNRVLS
jgi:ABC-2 type transport system permease protein